MSTLIQTKLFRFLSIFCTYLWEIYDLKNIFEIHGYSYFYGEGKKFLATCFCLILKWTYFSDIQSEKYVSNNPSLWKSALIYLGIFVLYYKYYIYVYWALVYHYCVSNILRRMKTVIKCDGRNCFFKLCLWAKYVFFI